MNKARYIQNHNIPEKKRRPWKRGVIGCRDCRMVFGCHRDLETHCKTFKHGFQRAIPLQPKMGKKLQSLAPPIPPRAPPRPPRFELPPGTTPKRKLNFESVIEPKLKWKDVKASLFKNEMSLSRDAKRKNLILQNIQFPMKNKLMNMHPLRGFTRNGTSKKEKEQQKKDEVADGNVHIFIDLSNLICGSQTLKVNSGRQKQILRDPRIRVNIPKLVQMIEMGRDVATRCVVGSHTSKYTKEWQEEWQGLSYKTASVMRDLNGKEVGVDEFIHAQLSRVLLKDHRNTQTLVLVTGDGNDNKDNSNFPEIIEAAMRKGWQIELWAWDCSVSHVYRKFAIFYPRQFQLQILDFHRKQITFKRSNENVLSCQVRNQSDFVCRTMHRDARQWRQSNNIGFAI